MFRRAIETGGNESVTWSSDEGACIENTDMIFEMQPCLLPREPRSISAEDQLKYLQAEASNRPMSMILLWSRGKAAVLIRETPRKMPAPVHTNCM